MDLGLKDGVAIVAAASKGPGKAVALGLAKSVSNELPKDGIKVNSVCPSTAVNTRRCSNLGGGGGCRGMGMGAPTPTSGAIRFSPISRATPGRPPEG